MHIHTHVTIRCVYMICLNIHIEAEKHMCAEGGRDVLVYVYINMYACMYVCVYCVCIYIYT